MNTYLHKQAPWAHQKRIFLESRDKPVWAFFMEQGTGKSKVMIDTACWNYSIGRVDALLLVCDKGIVRTWLEEHLPDNLPDSIPWSVHAYDATRMGTIKAKAACEAILTAEGLAIVITNWAAFRTDKGRAFLRRFIARRKVIMMLDESDAIKGPAARQTKAIVAFGRQATMRRIATGTPVADGPFDVFSQLKFLDPNILGISSFTAFKHEYGVFERFFTGAHSFMIVKHYQNLDELQRIIGAHSHRVLKADCFDLPPKVYERVHVELGAEARAMHKALKEHVLAEAEAVVNPLVKVLRAAQIASGFYIGDSGRPVFFADQPKAGAVVQAIQRMGKDAQFIVWGQFLAEMQVLAAALEAAGITFVRYDGSIDPGVRDEAEREFKAGGVQGIVATTQAAGKGRNWQNASAAFYHSNSSKLSLRLQSEDRCHRGGGPGHSVTYFDFCAEGTGDAKRLDVLRAKKSLADLITGDNVGEWL